MRSLEQLRTLIRTLEPVETDWIRSYGTLSEEVANGNLFDLFEALLEEEKQGPFEDREPDRRLRTLPEVQDRLWSFLMRALRDFHASDDLRAQVRNRIEEYHILHTKGLFDLADSVLMDGKEMARRYERFYEFLEIVNLEKTRLGRVTEIEEGRKQRESLEAEEEHSLQQLYNYTRYRNLSKRITEIYRSGNDADKESRLEKLGKIFNHPLLRSESSALSNTALYYQYHQKVTYFYYLGHLEQAYKTSNKLLQLLRTYPYLVDLSIDGFVVTSFNNLVCALDLGYYAEFDKSLTAFRKIPEVLSQGNSRRYNKMVFERAAYLELKKDLQLGRYEEGILTIPRIISEIEHWQDGIDPYFEGCIYYLFAYFYYLEQRFEQTLAWVHRIIENEKFREDQIASARMLGHLSEHELQMTEKLLRGVPQTRELLERTNRLYKAENEVLNTLMHISQAEETVELENEFRLLRENLTKIDAQVFGHDYLSNFDFRAWAESKLLGIPYKEVFLKKEEAGKFRAFR